MEYLKYIANLGGGIWTLDVLKTLGGANQLVYKALT